VLTEQAEKRLTDWRPVSNLDRLGRERPPVVEELQREAITLAGPEPTELLGVPR